MSLDPADFRPVNYIRPGALQARHAEPSVKIIAPPPPMKPAPLANSAAVPDKENKAADSDKGKTDMPDKSENGAANGKNHFIGLSQYDDKAKNVKAEPSVRFSRVPFARDLRLNDGEIVAPARTIVIKYKNQMFPGIVTDAEGRLYLYDRGKKFHRKVKLLEEKADGKNVYRVGYKTLGAGKNFVPLGRLEDFHALLSASNSGKMIVDISDNQKDFAANWMECTSNNLNDRSNYLIENARKIMTKPAARALRIGAITGSVGLVGAAVAGWAVAGIGGVNELPEGKKIDLSENEKIGITAGLASGTAITLGAAGAAYAGRKYRLKLLGKSANIIQPPAGYSDT